MTATTSDPPPASGQTAPLRGPGARRVRTGAIVFLALLGLGLTALTSVVFTGQTVSPNVVGVVDYVLLADLIYFALLVSMIGWRVWRLLAARRDKSAGAKLHLRLIGIFAIIAFAPAVIIAAFATLSVDMGIRTWFSGQVSSVVNNSLITAQAYAEEHRRKISNEALAMARDLNRAGAVGVSDPALADLLRGQQLLRRFPEAYLIDRHGEILNRGQSSYTFTYERPDDGALAAARIDPVALIEDRDINELRALVHLDNYIDTFLYVTSPIDGDVLALLDETAETIALYNRVEATRGQVLSYFALIYLGFALLVITIAAWLGLWLAERLSQPIGRLAYAAERVGEGDLDIRVPEENSGDEVALLSRVFNRMTAQVKGQRDELIAAHRESEKRRNFIETVLSGVSAGVIGLDEAGRVEMANAAARRMLGDSIGPQTVLPDEVTKIFEGARVSLAGAAQGQVTLGVGGEARELLVRVAARSSDDVGEGYVMTLDDLTALVSAQREAAWGDVARRIAHEIKNPLTPIQLSAERLRRKFAPIAGDDRASLEQYTDVIIRRAGDIRRMVDEFSKFARMPEPSVKTADLAALLRDAMLLQRTARSDIAFTVHGAEERVTARCDSGMISQALTNLVKNAVEAIDGRIETSPDFAGDGRIDARLEVGPDAVSFVIEDNGGGLPMAERAHLTEPYVTTREKGTGLGLAIVKKIAEQHGGALTLDNAPPDAGAKEGANASEGARVTFSLPRRAARRASAQDRETRATNDPERPVAANPETEVT